MNKINIANKKLLSIDTEIKKRENLHKVYIEEIDKITASYAAFKKLIRENNIQKNIVGNRIVYNSLVQLKKSTELFLFKYQEFFNGKY